MPDKPLRMTGIKMENKIMNIKKLLFFGLLFSSININLIASDDVNKKSAQESQHEKVQRLTKKEEELKKKIKNLSSEFEKYQALNALLKTQSERFSNT